MCLSYVLQALLCQKNYLLCTFMVLCCKPHGHCEHFHETQARKGCTMFEHSFTEAWACQWKSTQKCYWDACATELCSVAKTCWTKSSHAGCGMNVPTWAKPQAMTGCHMHACIKPWQAVGERTCNHETIIACMFTCLCSLGTKDCDMHLVLCMFFKHHDR